MKFSHATMFVVSLAAIFMIAALSGAQDAARSRMDKRGWLEWRRDSKKVLVPGNGWPVNA
ncbi:MAG TPA: hypothetical protein ENN29_12830 [Candidatus Hydrogenedentes bacterium]|nr:hypothetical protein [Candidatus Hydrogenedentota bacterium]